MRLSAPAAAGEGRPAPDTRQDGWQIARILAEHIRRTGTPCGRHSPAAPRDNCRDCDHEAVLNVYRGACEMAGVSP